MSHEFDPNCLPWEVEETAPHLPGAASGISVGCDLQGPGLRGAQLLCTAGLSVPPGAPRKVSLGNSAFPCRPCLPIPGGGLGGGALTTSLRVGTGGLFLSGYS